MTLTFDLTYDLDLGCFKVEFRNSCISGIVGLIDVKWKGREVIGYLADYMTLTFDHMHDLDLGVSRSESEIALSQEREGRLTWNEKDVSHPFMTMILTSVTMLGWADVPDNDRGDFRCQRGVDISSSVAKFLFQNLGPFFFIVKHSICHIWEMVGVVDMKWKADVLKLVLDQLQPWPMTLTIWRTRWHGYLGHAFMPHCTIFPHLRAQWGVITHAGPGRSIKCIFMQLC